MKDIIDRMLSHPYGYTWPNKKEVLQSLRDRLDQAPPPVPQREPFGPVDLYVGDNLDVLLGLLPTYREKVDLIYIDPPYGTGKNVFLYNDKWSSAISEDLPASLKNSYGYASFILPRLILAHSFLSEVGSIWVSIDDREAPCLRMLLTEIFGADNFMAQVVWYSMYGSKYDAKGFSRQHEYILVYAKNKTLWESKMRNLLPRTAKMDGRYKNPDNDPRGPWTSSNLSARSSAKSDCSHLRYPIIHPVTGEKILPPSGCQWKYAEEKFWRLHRENRIWWGRDGKRRPSIKKFLSEVQQGRIPPTIWLYDEVGHTDRATKEVKARIPIPRGESTFNAAKPVALIERILKISTKSNSVILDFFAGTGTTGETVMKSNVEDGGERSCILIQKPEPVDIPGYATIADMTRTRLDSAYREYIKGEKPAQHQQDLGILSFFKS